MREKLTIEQFRNIKNQLNNLIEEYENIEEENKGNRNFNKEAIEKTIIYPNNLKITTSLKFDKNDIL